MNKRFGCFAWVACLTLALAGCGENKETRAALDKAKVLEDQQQYQEANSVLVNALEARETEVRGTTPPTDPDALAALGKKVQSDPEILKMERAQIRLYLQMERADLASGVYHDILQGSPNDSAVLDLANDPAPMIRAGVVRVLGLTENASVIPALIKATTDSDKEVRRAAVAALGSLKDPQTIDPLISSLKDSYWFARSAAADSLGQQGDPRAIKPLLDAIADDDSDVESSAGNALLLLSQVKGASAEDFANRLNDPNAKIARISAICLASMKDARAVPYLQKQVASTDLQTRLLAIKALGQCGDPSVLPILRQTLKDPDINVRGWSIIGLGVLKDKESLPALTAMETDPQESDKIHDAAKGAVEHITGVTPAAPDQTPSANP